MAPGRQATECRPAASEPIREPSATAGGNEQTMTEDETTPQGEFNEELSAYLDGELDAQAVKRVEERLAREPAYQAELQRLERAWQLLDGLPRASVNEAFTKTTIEMVAVAAGQDAAAVQDAWPRQKRRQQWLGGGALAAAGLVGFAVGHWLWPNPNDQLLRDLPVLENFELYYQADNIDFLRMLENEGLFAEGDNDHAG
jgi:anti-sigma factor RsiW